MSAINDALRRASGAAAGGNEPPPLPVGDSVGALPPPLSGIALADDGLPPLLQPPGAKKAFPWILVVVAFLFCVGGAAGFYWWKQRNQRPVVVLKPAKPVEAAARSTVEKQPTTPAPSTEKPNASSAAPEKAVATAPALVAPPIPRPPVQFPQLRLQGIYFKPSNPSVMINNHTLFLNDQIQGVTVAGIDSSSVTLVLSGQTNVLTLR
jgi:hypothetical protein